MDFCINTVVYLELAFLCFFKAFSVMEHRVHAGLDRIAFTVK